MTSSMIYVVDDDQAVRESFRAVLESFDYEVEDYDSAFAFLKAYRPGAAHCLLLDLHMPRLSGLDLLGLLRDGTSPRLPVVIITGRGDPGQRRRALAAGADAYLEKPVDCAMLLDTIEALASR